MGPVCGVWGSDLGDRKEGRGESKDFGLLEEVNLSEMQTGTPRFRAEAHLSCAGSSWCQSILLFPHHSQTSHTSAVGEIVPQFSAFWKLPEEPSHRLV